MKMTAAAWWRRSSMFAQRQPMRFAFLHFDIEDVHVKTLPGVDRRRRIHAAVHCRDGVAITFKALLYLPSQSLIVVDNEDPFAGHPALLTPTAVGCALRVWRAIGKLREVAISVRDHPTAWRSAAKSSGLPKTMRPTNSA